MLYNVSLHPHLCSNLNGVNVKLSCFHRANVSPVIRETYREQNFKYGSSHHKYLKVPSVFPLLWQHSVRAGRHRERRSNAPRWVSLLSGDDGHHVQVRFTDDVSYETATQLKGACRIVASGQGSTGVGHCFHLFSRYLNERTIK